MDFRNPVLGYIFDVPIWSLCVFKKIEDQILGVSGGVDLESIIKCKSPRRTSEKKQKISTQFWGDFYAI